MSAMLQKLREKRENGDHGFTLIELLVVVVIIGILVAIAIPLYLHFRQGAENRSAQSDVRNAVATIEQCFNENDQQYPATFGASTTAVDVSCGTDTETVNVSSGNTIAYTNNGTTYQVVGHSSDSGKTYTYDSSTGQTVES